MGGWQGGTPEYEQRLGFGSGTIMEQRVLSASVASVCGEKQKPSDIITIWPK